MDKPYSSDKLRRVKDKCFKIFIFSLSVLAIIPLLFILIHIVREGAEMLSLKFLVELPKPPGEEGGGILNALLGTGILVLIASVISIPLGIAAGIYLAEKSESKIATLARLCVEILQSIPSIVIGIMVYLWIVLPTKSFSALAGGFALAIIMLPLVVRSTEETMKLIPQMLKEAALALGVPYYKVILKVVLPASLSGILTGILIGIARIAGETAPLLFTSFGSPYLTLNILKPISALPLLIFNYATSPYEEWHKVAWGASFVLVTLILVLSITARVMTRKWKTRF
ncbi:MAG: phosphate ABC transporter permease PstA [Synergistetes bacterium]|nr:MAG: Phosphate ABC transporter, inner membrane subunit PstA [Thermodesulfobacterium commune]MBC7332474.1 phosphate ABC transporter permease PstA [Synergistota bacterium]MDK2871990.1 phosphate transport system permease protein [bacterium]